MVRLPGTRRRVPMWRIDASRRWRLRSQWSQRGRRRAARSSSVAAAVTVPVTVTVTPRWLWCLVAAVIALEVPYPLVHGHARNVLTVATVVVFAATSLAHAWCSSGRRRVVRLLSVAVFGFTAEVVGVHTGVPFGDYHYIGGLGPTVAGVPVGGGLAWMMMAQPAACGAERISRGRARVVVAAVALASWDVFLDP